MWSKKHLEQLKATGKIRDFTDSTQKSGENIPQETDKNIPTKKKQHKIKEWIELNLEYWCEAHRLKLETEFMFDPERLWRFDFAVRKKKIAWEYEGLMSKKSRHTTIGGFTGDAEKYNEAAAHGWRVIRYTAKNYKQLITDLNKLI